MEQSELMSNEAKEHVEQNVMDSMGNPEHVAEHAATGDSKHDELPAFAKERLGRQEKRHQREMRALRDQVAQMQSSQTQANPSQNVYGGQQQMSNVPMSQDDQIQKAVSLALQQREMKEQQAKQAEQAAHVQRQYSNLQDRLDNGSNKYDDFDEVVRGNNVPFTPHMRDASLLLHNPEDVLYKLGKNPDELSRISKLHPLDQAKEMVKLSIALASGNGANQTQTPKTLSNVKNNPINIGGVTENTSIGDLRKQMKNWRK